MGIIKLQDEGQEHTMTITECEAAQGQFGEQVKFSDGRDVLYLPKDSADRQLNRIGLDYASAIGVSLRFSRDHNPKKGAKPYWGITVAGRGQAPSAPSKRLPPPETVPPRQGGAKHIPGLDDPPDGEIPDWHNAPLPESPDGFEQFSNAIDAIAQPAQTPRETADAMLKAKKRHDFLGFYAATFAQLKEMLPDGTSDDAVQAATATNIIHFGKVGLLP